MIEINNHDDFASYLGNELGTSAWYQITQDQINKFADATLDHQWIHTDTERAAVESPFKTTIAHGYLTLSLVPYLWQRFPRPACMPRPGTSLVLSLVHHALPPSLPDRIDELSVPQPRPILLLRGVYARDT